MNNIGIFVEKANNCYLLSSLAQKSRTNFATQLGINPAKSNLIGKQCTIIAGPWKGYQCIVKEANERNCRIELTSKCRIIDMARDLIKLTDEVNDHAGVESYYNGNTFNLLTFLTLNF